MNRKRAVMNPDLREKFGRWIDPLRQRASGLSLAQFTAFQLLMTDDPNFKFSALVEFLGQRGADAWAFDSDPTSLRFFCATGDYMIGFTVKPNGGVQLTHVSVEASALFTKGKSETDQVIAKLKAADVLEVTQLPPQERGLSEKLIDENWRKQRKNNVCRRILVLGKKIY